jgi:glycosyltransferase involved in cell wall biosynthesis
MKILFITQVVPFPPAGGEKIRSFGLLRCFAQPGYDVIAVTPELEQQAEAEKQLPGISFIPFKYDSGDDPFSQFAGYFRPDKRLKTLILTLISSEHFDIAFIDYFFLGQYISVIKSHGIPVIYGTHNAQSLLRLQQPGIGITGFVTRIFSYFAQALHERIYFRKADHLICVSEIDRLFYLKFIRKNKISVIPNFVDESLYRPAAEKKPYIIMTGNFSSFQNYHGLAWFLQEVWNEELEGITSLYLVGKGAKKAMADAAGSRVIRNLVIMEDPADFARLIASATVAVVPLWHGSGTRLKCIEAMALKTQLVSTTIGAEGIIHKGSILIADTPELFREQTKLAALRQVDHTELAFRAFFENYSLEVNKGRIHSIINCLVPVKK